MLKFLILFFARFLEFRINCHPTKRQVEIMRKPDNKAKESKMLLDKAGQYFDAEDFTKALTYTNRSIKKDPKNAEAHFVKGNVLLQLAEPCDAIKAFNDAMDLGHRDEVIYTNRGTAFKKIKRPNKALADYNLALEINPDFYPTYALRGSLLLKKKDYINAIKDFDYALQIEPDNFDLVLSKCSAYEKSGDPLKALKEVKDFISLRKNNDISEYLMARGILYSKCGYPHEAIQDFSQLIYETDCLLTAYKWRYKNYLEIGESEKAKADKDKINELENNDGVFIEYFDPIEND